VMRYTDIQVHWRKMSPGVTDVVVYSVTRRYSTGLTGVWCTGVISVAMYRYFGVQCHQALQIMWCTVSPGVTGVVYRCYWCCGVQVLQVLWLQALQVLWCTGVTSVEVYKCYRCCGVQVLQVLWCPGVTGVVVYRYYR
jgi:hypothetical protein